MKSKKSYTHVCVGQKEEGRGGGAAGGWVGVGVGRGVDGSCVWVGGGVCGWGGEGKRGRRGWGGRRRVRGGEEGEREWGGGVQIPLGIFQMSVCLKVQAML